MMNMMLNVMMMAMCLFVSVGVGFMIYTLMRLAKEVFKDENPECRWYGNDDILDQSYKTECGETFYDATESGEPVTDWVKYCPYCSREVKLEVTL